jgi:hypothetical protein
VAQGLHNVAYVIYRQYITADTLSVAGVKEIENEAIKAENFAREALRIR